jgi:uncharacterized protein YhaN
MMIPRGRTRIVAAVALTVFLAGCSAGTISYEESAEIYETITDLQESLVQVESRLVEVTDDEAVDGEVEQTVSRAADEVAGVATSLATLSERFEPLETQEIPQEIPAEPQPSYWLAVG